MVETGEVPLRFHIYSANLLLYLNPDSSAVFFLTGGTGGITIQEKGTYWTQTYFQFNFGGGAKIKLSDSFYVRGDFKDFVFHIDYWEQGTDIMKGWMHNPGVTFGIGAYF